jgi:hypothetical protein
MMRAWIGSVVACALVAVRADAGAIPGDVINVVLNGQNVLDAAGHPGAGDPDAFATATLRREQLTLVWQITYGNLSGDTITGVHVHNPVGNFGFIDLPLPAGRPLPGGTIGGVMTSADDPGLPTKMAGVFATDFVGDYYLDVHTSGAGGYPDGAVRGQLPEPGGVGVAILGAGWMGARRRRRLR